MAALPIVEEPIIGEKGKLEQLELENPAIPREHLEAYDTKLHRRVMLKLDLLLLPLLTTLYLCASLDKSNLGNSKTLGMVKDFGGDPTGQKYALLNSMFFISFAVFLIPLSLLAKGTRFAIVLPGAGVVWGAAAMGFAGVHGFGGAKVARFFIGLGEAGFGGAVQVYMARFYYRKALGVRVGFWLAMAPIAGFINGMIAYGVSFVHGRIADWRILFLIEGGATVLAGILGLLLLPEDIPRCRWLTQEEKDHILFIRALEVREETTNINWKQAGMSFLRWQLILPVMMYGTQQISGAALSAFLPTLTQENGFKGATAQLATLAPYGSAALVMIFASYMSDKYQNRGVPIQIGFATGIAGFGAYLGASPTNHAAHYAGLILAEIGHYICTPLIIVWVANNSGSESRRTVSVPALAAVAQAIAVGSGYLFPAPDKPRYIKGNAVCLSLSAFGMIACGAYQYLVWRENKQRDQREGKPAPGFQPDTITYADEAPGFRYFY